MGPAETILGATLSSGWNIVKKLNKGATGGNFGTAYLAERDGARGVEIAFVKALDFEAAFSDPNPMKAFGLLQSLAAYEFEITDFCTQQGMKNVVMSFGQDQILPPAAKGDPMRMVFCIIMERGEGDLRKKLVSVGSQSIAWKLAVLRDIAAGVAQMHKADLAHQDIKPSNIITMGDEDGFPNSKVGDLGRVVRKSGGPYNDFYWPGDNNYAPPERHYGHRPTDWRDEREASDAFLLASMILFLFSGVPLLSSLFDEVPDNLKPGVWGSYDSTVKAALIRAAERVIEGKLRPELPHYADEICTIARELSHPDPAIRGDRRARKQNQVGMDRIWSRLRLLAEKARIKNV